MYTKAFYTSETKQGWFWKIVLRWTSLVSSCARDLPVQTAEYYSAVHYTTQVMCSSYGEKKLSKGDCTSVKYGQPQPDQLT